MLESGDNTSYFLSWGWIGNWLESLPEKAKPVFVVLRETEEPLIGFFLGKADMVGAGLLQGKKSPVAAAQDDEIYDSMYCGRHLFGRRAWFLNATGNPAFDRLHIEYNGFLSREQRSYELSDILKNLPDSWDEFYLQGVDASCLPGMPAPDKTHPYKIIVDREMLSPFVDLEMVRESGKDYLTFLSANTRGQINKTYRLCQRMPVRLEAARDISEALDIFRELVILHEDHWTKKAGGGAFSTAYLYRFHEDLIKKRFGCNEIQLLRIKCGDKTAGCLYNFVYKENVLFYQSGINYGLDRQMKPGYVSHVEAIRHNAAAGYKTYDFMCGGERYKMSLATHHNRMLWLRVQKPLWKFRIEQALKLINRKLRKQ